MRLITKDLLERFAAVGPQEHVHDPLVIARYFLPGSTAIWLAVAYEPSRGLFVGKTSIFGMESLGSDRWGTFSLDDLRSVRSQLGLRVERDRFFVEAPLSTVIEFDSITANPMRTPLCTWDAGDLIHHEIVRRQEEWQMFGYASEPSNDEAERDVYDDRGLLDAEWEFVASRANVAMRRR